MGRRDPDPRPPIEIVGAEPAPESFQRVTSGPRGPTRRGGRVLAVAAGAVLVLLGTLALGGDDDAPVPATGPAEERDNSAKLPLKRSSTTTRPTTTTVAAGPVLGTPVGAGLLVYGELGWRLVDLDTGGRTTPDLPSQNPYDVVPVDGGVVTVDRDATRVVAFRRIGPSGDIGPPVVLGLADQVLSAGRPDRLWLVDGGGRFNDGGAFVQRANARLVDLQGDVLRSFEVDAQFVSQGLGDGVVFERGGRIYLADEEGVRAVAVGWSIGVMGDDVLVFSCDDAGECAVVRQPVDGGSASTLFDVADVESAAYDSRGGPDGRIALTSYAGPSGQSLFLFAADGTSLGTIDELPPSLNGPPSWLPGDLGLVAPARDGVQWIHETSVTWVSTQLLGLEDLPAEVVVVIDW